MKALSNTSSTRFNEDAEVIVGPAPTRILLHFHNREILGAHGALRNGNDRLLRATLLLTKYALLASPGPLVILPKFAFEVPYFSRYLWATRSVAAAGLMQYANDNPDFSYQVADKKKQYGEQQSLFPMYFDQAQTDRRLKLLTELSWTQRLGPPASIEIARAWRADLEADTDGILTQIAIDLASATGESASRLVTAMENLPESLAERAFVIDHVRPILNANLSGAQLTRMNMLINGAYLRALLTAHDFAILVDTPLGNLDCGLQTVPAVRHNMVSFGDLRQLLGHLGLATAVEGTLSWPDLVELRQDLVLRWFMRLVTGSASGDHIAGQLIDETFRSPSVSKLLVNLCPPSGDLVSVRRHLAKLWEAVDAVPGLGKVLARYDFAFATSEWLSRRQRRRAKAEDDRETNQLMLPIETERKRILLSMGVVRVSIVIITVREDEFRAVLEKFPDREHHDASRFYEIGHLRRSDTGESLHVAILRLPEQGNGPALDSTKDAIGDFDPDAIVLVGIGGALPAFEYSLGDVVLATSVQDLRVRAVLQDAPDQFGSTGSRAHKAITLLLAHLPAFSADLGNWRGVDLRLRPTFTSQDLRPKQFYGGTEWRQQVRSSLNYHFGGNDPRSVPLVTSGAIASSDTLVKDANFASQTKSFVRQVLAFEMEAAGVFQGADQRRKQYPVLVARGISDVVGFRRSPKWTEYAAASAASFVAELLTSGLLSRAVGSVADDQAEQ